MEKTLDQMLIDEAVELFEIQRRRKIPDPAITAELQALCERHGYGNVIATASELWRRKDPVGAFTVGHCVGTVEGFLQNARARSRGAS